MLDMTDLDNSCVRDSTGGQKPELMKTQQIFVAFSLDSPEYTQAAMTTARHTQKRKPEAVTSNHSTHA